MKTFQLLLLTAVTLLNYSCAVITGDVGIAPATVSSSSQLTFEVQLGTQIPTGGKLVLTFSQGFDLRISTGLKCASVYALTELTECTADSATQLTINGAKSSDYLAIFTVNNVRLPQFVSTFFVLVTSYRSDGLQIETSGPTAFKLSTEPDRLAVELAPKSNIVGAMTDLQMTITSSQIVRSSGSIRITLPKWNSGTQSISLVLPFFDTSSLVLAGSDFMIPCTALNHPNIKCLFAVENPSTVQDIARTFDTLQLSGFSTDFQTITVVTSNQVFRNPPSAKLINTFTAATYSQTGLMVTSAAKISLRVTQAADLPQSAVKLQVQDGGINVLTAFQFTIQTPLPGPVGLKIMIKIPQQLEIVSIQDPSQVVLTSAAGYAPVADIPHLEILNRDDQSVMLSLLVPNQNYYVDEGNFIRFVLFDIVNAPSMQTSDSFELTFYEFDDVIMKVTQGITVTADPGKLQSVVIEPEGYRVREEVPYTFSFVTSNRVFTNGQISIQVPGEVKVTGDRLKLVPIKTVSEDGKAKLSWVESTRTIKITNAFKADFTTPQLVEFQINTGIKNADSAKPVNAFLIQTLDGNGAIIDAGNSTRLAYTGNEIGSIVVTACSNKQMASETEDVCTYELEFLIGANYPILSGSTIEIELPEDLSLSLVRETEANSRTAGIADLSAKFRVLNAGRTVQVLDAFNPLSAPNGVDYRQDSFAVSIAGVVSPRTTAPTLSFKARIKSSEGYLQYSRLQGIYSNVFQARPFSKVVIQRTNQTNGDDSGRYNFTLQFSSAVNRNEYIKIVPPKDVIINPGGAGQCMGMRLLSTILACNIIDGSLFVLIEPLDQNILKFNQGDIVQFQVSDIRNPLSLEPTESFNVYIATSTSQNYYVNQMVQGLSVLNSLEGQLIDVRLIPDTNQFSAVTDYSIYFVTANIVEMSSYIRIQFPKDFYLFRGDRQPCTAIKNIESSLICTPSAGNIITITKGYSGRALPAGSEVGIKLKSVTNPSKSVSNAIINEQFIIQTISADNYGIDRSNQLDFSIGCTYPCQSCDQLQTKCTSCQMLNENTFLYLYKSQCNVECPIGTYPDMNYVCQACDPLCQKCSMSPDVCDSCREELGFPYVTQEGTCTQKCTNGTFVNEAEGKCQTCEGNCNTCASAIECLSCDLGYYFIDGQCLSKCPSYSIQFDSVEVQECQRCKEPCATCTDTIDKCTSCSPQTFLHQNQCLDRCPTTYLPDDQNVCYMASEKTYPFISLSLTAVILFIILINLCISKSDIRIYQIFMALESCVLVFFWIYMLVFLIRDGHQASATLVSLALFANYVINYLWWEFYNDKIHSQNVPYQQFAAQYPKTSALIKYVSLCVSSDFFRLSYSYMFKLPQLQADMLKKDKFYKRINRYSLFSITFVYVPTLVAASYNLFYTWYGRQIFWIDIECIAVVAAMLIFKLVVIFASEREYIHSVLSKQQKVMSANVDDEPESKVNEEALWVAHQIQSKGIEKTRFQIRNLNHEQRVVAVKAVFQKLLNGKTSDGEYLFHHAGNYKTHQPRKTYDEIPDDTMQQTMQLNQDTQDEQDGGGAPMQTMLINQTTDQDEIVQDRKRMQNDDDFMNFQSAPLNAQSAFQGNKGLESRHQKFQEELLNLKSKTGQNLLELQFEQDHGNLPFNKTMAKKAQIPRDSDDSIKDFTSEQWGPGASKVVAEHFNTVQARSKLENPADTDKSTIPKDLLETKLTQEVFQKKIQEIYQQQATKRLAKEKAFEFSESSKRLDDQLTKQRNENDQLRDLIKQLEIQIAGEIGRLNGVRQTKKDELEFAENAFYTSNESGMGVSPNNFISQNRMPIKPSSKPKDPARKEQPVNQVSPGQIKLEDQILLNESGRAELEKSRLSFSAAKSISASEIKKIGRMRNGQDNLESDDSASEQETLDRALLVQTSELPLVLEGRKKIAQASSGSRKKRRFAESISKSSVESSGATNKRLGQSVSKTSLQESSSRKRRLAKSKSVRRISVEDANIVNSSRSESRGTKQRHTTKRGAVKGTEGTVTRKAHQKDRSRSGIKSNRSSSLQKDNRQLKHRPINQEKDKYEYYTTEDEFGLPVNKLRKKQSTKKQKNESSTKRKQVSKPRKEQNEESLEFYSTVDKQGKRVQKLRKKNKSKSVNAKHQNMKPPRHEEEKNQFNFRPDFAHLEQSTIKGSVMGATDDNFAKFSVLSGLTTGQREVPKTGRSQSNNAPVPMAQTQKSGTEVHSQMTTYRATDQERKIKNSQALRDAGITVMKLSQERGGSKRKKKQSAPQRDYSGVYFNHTNFEKAVIATNGRAPFNNKEVEIISKKKEFDPKEFQFRNMNNWVNQTINETNRIPQSHNSPRPRRRGNNDMASASVTATTVFQGMNNSGMLGSVQNTEAKQAPIIGLSQTQQQFGFGSSPVTMFAREQEGGTDVNESPLARLIDQSSPEERPLGSNLIYEQAQSYLQRMPPSRE